jgi:hypothetical protein
MLGFADLVGVGRGFHMQNVDDIAYIVNTQTVMQ